MKEFFLYPICKLLDIILPKRILKGIPVLMYHSIREDNGYLSVSPSDFEQQIKYLLHKGYQNILPQDLLGKDLSYDRKIMITFDDGFKDNYTVALLIFKKYNFTAAVFVITGQINSPGKLTAEEINSLEENGWLIANHFDSHHDLTELKSEEISQDFEIARQKLSQLLINKETANIVSYPHSRYNEKVIEAVKKAGVIMAFNGGNRYFRQGDSLFSISRIEISQRVSFLKFKLILSPSFDLIKRIFNARN